MDKQSTAGSAKAGRRGFLKSAGAGLAGSLILNATGPNASAQEGAPESITHAGAGRPLTDKEKIARIASNTWPIRYIFKSHAVMAAPQEVEQMKKKYGEITMLDFPDFTKQQFPGVYQMDLFSGLFGDAGDDSMFVTTTINVNGSTHTMREFDPASASGKKWLEKMSSKMVATGTKCHHISNNAPRDICELDTERRKAGIEVAKKWLDGAAMLGAKSMRVNSGGPRIAPTPVADPSSYPKNDALAQYLTNCIESFKEMADYGGKLGVKVTLENHWGLTASPTNIRIIVEEVNNPFCEASPDFCNWEHEYLLFHGLQELAPYAHTNVHAKYWSRWKNPDVQRNVRIMLNANYTGLFALEYEEGPWDGVEGAKYLYREVMAAL
ncbi:MAG: TIM barrel protein [Acidobacteriaceae bacterium]|nr:TIM barrel protein [Acidobacteriaceae bacterium]MBV9502697.1 TIM barrel protein [Acidobacteriaceae bacterium]